MNRVRPWFDALWPRLESYGLRLTGAWIFMIGVLVIKGLIGNTPTAVLLGVPAGAALILAGILTFDRSREDLVTWVVAGIATLVFALSLAASAAPDPKAMNADAYPPAVVVLALALFGVRAFRGAFRRHRASPGAHDAT